MPLTTTELESTLWRAADILRGQIDSSDYKNYIFSMLFLKRLSDRFAEEVESAAAAGTSPTMGCTFDSVTVPGSSTSSTVMVTVMVSSAPTGQRRLRSRCSCWAPSRSPERPWSATGRWWRRCRRWPGW